MPHPHPSTPWSLAVHSPTTRAPELRSRLQELLRSAPWLIMVLLAVIAGWTAEETLALLALLIPVIAHRAVQGRVAAW